MKKKKSQKAKTDVQGVLPEFKKRAELIGDVVDFSDAPDELKLSDRIFRLIEPYMGSEEITVLVDCATIAWNECLQEDFEIKGSYNLNNVLLNFNNFRELIDALKFRKRKMFMDNCRHIREAKVYEKNGCYSINVASDFDMKTAFKRLLSIMEDE